MMKQRMMRFGCFLFLILLIACQSGEPEEAALDMIDSSLEGIKEIHPIDLSEVDTWMYLLNYEPEEELIQQLVDSEFDLLVLEPLINMPDYSDFPMAAVIQRLHSAAHPKLVIAYIDIGQAEEWRSYWQPGWRIGQPDFILGADPDSWEGNYPVAYWREEWQKLWLGEDGILSLLLKAGFDGVYLDWVGGYADEAVMEAAQREGVDPELAMIEWVGRLADAGRAEDVKFIVIGQNAVELTENEGYLDIIDGISQEQVWFDGGPDNQPPGDCPLPRSEEEVDSEEYIQNLSPACRRVYRDNPDGTLHDYSEYYLNYLRKVLLSGKAVFTVDYAVEAENVTWVHQTSREMGFIPFAGERDLGTFIPAYIEKD